MVLYAAEGKLESLKKKLKKVESQNLGPKIPLQERSDQLREVLKYVSDNLNKTLRPKDRISEKTDVMIPTFVGGSGIGKVVIHN